MRKRDPVQDWLAMIQSVDRVVRDRRRARTTERDVSGERRRRGRRRRRSEQEAEEE